MEQIERPIKRMRTIYDALDMIKEEDPNSAITYTFIRDLISRSLIGYTKIGNRFLINYDSLLDYLQRI